MLMIYFSVAGLSIMNAEFDKQSISDFVNLLAVKDNNDNIVGFRCSNFVESEPHAVHSYCAVATLLLLNSDISHLKDQQPIRQFILSLQNPDYCIRGSQTSIEADLRMTFSALAYLDILNLLY